jgi:hypothetical protein
MMQKNKSIYVGVIASLFVLWSAGDLEAMIQEPCRRSSRIAKKTAGKAYDDTHVIEEFETLAKRKKSFDYSTSEEERPKKRSKGTDGGSFNCEIYGHMSSDNHSLIKYIPINTVIKPFKCEIPDCDKAFAEKANLDFHVRSVHKGEKPFACMEPGCGKTFSKNSNLKVHICDVHQKKRPFKCKVPDCDRAFARNAELNIHVQSVHEKKKPFECTEPGCGKTFSQNSNMKTHVRKYHRNICKAPACGLEFTSKSELIRHRTIHGNERPYKCDEAGCIWSFAEKRYLIAHKKEIHSVRPYSCRVPGCDKTFTRKDRFETHQLQHTREILSSNFLEKKEDVDRSNILPLITLPHDNADEPMLLENIIPVIIKTEENIPTKKIPKKLISIDRIKEVFGRKTTRINPESSSQNCIDCSISFYNWINTQGDLPKQIISNFMSFDELPENMTCERKFAVIKNKEDAAKIYTKTLRLNLEDGSAEPVDVTFDAVVFEEEGLFELLSNYINKIPFKSISGVAGEFRTGLIYLLLDESDDVGHMVNFYCRKNSQDTCYIIDSQINSVKTLSNFIRQESRAYQNYCYIYYDKGENSPPREALNNFIKLEDENLYGPR